MREKKCIKRTTIVSPSFSDKSCLLLKKPTLVLNGDVFVSMGYPELYNDEFQAVEIFAEINEFEGDIVVFDDVYFSIPFCIFPFGFAVQFSFQLCFHFLNFFSRSEKKSLLC